jgi:4-hydroxybenzoate polyprenyltransferase
VPPHAADAVAVARGEVTAGLVRSLRPKQWLKNGFVAAPALFAREFDDVSNVLTVAAAVACFCAASSAVYLVNDVVDRDEDRHHPDKRTRPIAAGIVPVRVALWAAVVLGAVALAAAVALDPWFAAVLAGYVVMSLVYSLALKDEVILDVMWIAAGFLLRVAAGAVVIRVEPSPWIFICTALLALMLAFGKRRCEVHTLEDGGVNHRPVLRNYSVSFLDSMLQITAATTVASYAVYTATGAPADDHLAGTLPFVLYGILRYMWLVIHEGKGSSPTALVWSDRPLQVTIVLWVVTSAVLLSL